MLVDVDGKTHRRVADDLGLSVSGMKSRVQRARGQLRELLEQCCVIGLDRTGAIATVRSATTGCNCDDAAVSAASA
jgi:RNA polymerase sigma-70 factor (ECF subfamily)